MPAAPFFIAIAGASGLTATIGTAIATTIGLGTVSAATAFAIGTGAITGTLAIAEGKKFDDVLKSAVVGGLTSYIGANVADTISNDVFWKSIDSGITGTTAKVIADAIGQGVGGALQGGITALAYDEKTNLLHVGTSSGRSDFNGLRRINNTTEAVTTAISAYDGSIAQQ